MSDLLNSASLVVIPSGYKEDTVYSVVPSDGSGDLSFTRASNGTRINSAGLVEVTPWNDLTYSEDFTNAVWTKITATVTANSTTAPNGTNTATKFESTGSGVPQLSRGITGTNTISIYAKAGNISSFRMWIGSEVIFDLSTGTVTAGTATMENVGNGWYRCIISATTAGSVNPYFVSTASGQFVYVWGAQLNIGSTAKPYFPTTDRLNVPRLTYQNGGGGCPSLLLEKQSTNLALWSEDFTNAVWSKSDFTISANQIVSPDGTQNADKIIANSNNAAHAFYQGVTVGTYTFSIYAKAGEESVFSMWLDDFGKRAIFDLSNGTITNSNVTNANITSVGNGWYRCDVYDNSLTSYIAIYGRSANAYIGNGTDGFYLWGAQAEAGSYPTSYIPTTSASATRVADACFKTGISSLIGQTEGTMFVEGSTVGIESIKSNLFGALEKTSSGATIRIFYDGNSNTILGDVYTGSAFSAQMIGGLIPVGQTFKCALAYKNNDFALAVNGVVVATDTSGSVPATDDLKINTSLYNNLDAGVKQSQLALFKTRLTNAELVSLTTI
jgi:hypothetical protein